MFLVVLLAVLSIAFSADIEYTKGRGLKIHHINTTVGGYVTVSAKKDRNMDDAKVLLNDLTVFTYGNPTPHILYFLELDLKDVATSQYYISKEHIDIERLYISFEVTDAFGVKVGRFMTPIGIWNPIHIDILKWTVSDPLLTTRFFPTFTTGIQFYGRSSEGMSYTFTFKNNGDLSRDRNNMDTKRMLIGGLKAETPVNIKAGVDVGWFDMPDLGEETAFYGVNAIYKQSRVELSGEITYAIEQEYYRSNSISYKIAYYIQSVYRLLLHNYAVFRLDHFKDTSEGKNEYIYTLGWNYRPFYYSAIKAEYQSKNNGISSVAISLSWVF